MLSLYNLQIITTVIVLFCVVAISSLTLQQASAQPGPAVTLTKNSDMDFGDLNYAATYSGTLQLATNGNLILSGATGLSTNGSASGQAGSVTITSASGIVEIKCETGGSMKNGPSTLDITNTEIAIDAGVNFGSGTPCQGIKNPNPVVASVDLAENPTPVILIGGDIVIVNGSLNSGTYSTAIGGGKPIVIRVVFQ